MKLKVKQVKRNKKPLYKLLEESFDKELKNQEDARKLVLDKIRLRSRPIDIENINMHAAKHD